MKFTTFKTPKPKDFSYKPRYYDKAKDERDRRRTELGYESKFGEHDSLRMKMANRWRKGEEVEARPITKLLTYLVYATVIFGSIYFIFFTDIVDNLVALFGVKSK